MCYTRSGALPRNSMMIGRGLVPNGLQYLLIYCRWNKSYRIMHFFITHTSKLMNAQLAVTFIAQPFIELTAIVVLEFIDYCFRPALLPQCKATMSALGHFAHDTSYPVTPKWRLCIKPSTNLHNKLLWLRYLTRPVNRCGPKKCKDIRMLPNLLTYFPLSDHHFHTKTLEFIT